MPRPATIVLALLFSCCCATISSAQDALYSEPHRPQYHFTPERNWMNDPNGLVYHNGEYHLFYQYNPHGDTWGHMSWGHAVSEDLLHWKHLPVALHEENGVMIFSGSAVVDRDNTSGFGAKDKPPLVAIYTGHTDRKQSQHIAYSTDQGRTWTKYKDNPVIDENLKDFRDPKVMWHEPTKRWIMTVALPDQQKGRARARPDQYPWRRPRDPRHLPARRGHPLRPEAPPQRPGTNARRLRREEPASLPRSHEIRPGVPQGLLRATGRPPRARRGQPGLAARPPRSLQRRGLRQRRHRGHHGPHLPQPRRARRLRLRYRRAREHPAFESWSLRSVWARPGEGSGG